MKVFYMCYVDGQRGATKKHDTFELAHTEAQRLANLNPRAQVTILEAVSSVIKSDLVFAGRLPELPF